MTKEEFLAVKKHVRIKYIGKDETVIGLLEAEHNRSAQLKGWVLSMAWDGYNREGITLWLFHGPRLDGIKPEDWEVVDDKRIDLQRKRESRQSEHAREVVNEQLGNYISGYEFQRRKRRIDRVIGALPLSARFALLADLTPEQKAWYQFIQKDPEDITAMIRKVIDDDDKEETTTDDSATDAGSTGA